MQTITKVPSNLQAFFKQTLLKNHAICQTFAVNAQESQKILEYSVTIIYPFSKEYTVIVQSVNPVVTLVRGV